MNKLVYLPIASTPRFQSFSAPILNLDNTHVTAPFFSANVFTGELRPVPGGNIPPHHSLVDLKMAFKEGGAFDFSTTYDRLKEQMTQTLSVARENGNMPGFVSGGLPHADLEQLPAYEETGGDSTAQPNVASPPTNSPQASASSHEPIAEPTNEPNIKSEAPQESYPAPNEPPPGYEETQAASVARDMEENIRRMGGSSV